MYWKAPPCCIHANIPSTLLIAASALYPNSIPQAICTDFFLPDIVGHGHRGIKISWLLVKFTDSPVFLNLISKVNQNWFTFSSQDFGMNLNWFTLERIWICMRIRFDFFPPLWAGTCFASIACGHPHAHFWGVPQTPWGRSASIKKASRRIKRLAFYKEIRTTHLAGVLQLQIPRGRTVAQDASQLPHGIA